MRNPRERVKRRNRARYASRRIRTGWWPHSELRIGLARVRGLLITERITDAVVWLWFNVSPPCGPDADSHDRAPAADRQEQ